MTLKSIINIFKPHHRWNNRKMAFVSILIATSVAFVVLFARILPITAIPSFKISIGGLPIKITGYIFGPLIGLLTGVISDLLSFLMFPTFFHPWYTAAFGFAGFVPGVVGYIMNRRWKYKGITPPKDKIKYNKVNFLITVGTCLMALGIIVVFILTRSEAEFSQSALLKNRWAFLGVVASGPLSMGIATVIARFVLSPKTFNSILPIVTFSVILDIINTPLVTLGDIYSFKLTDDFMTLLVSHTLLTPFKSWGNLFIIYFAYKVVSPLIYNKTSNGWENETSDKIILEETQELKVDRIQKARRKSQLRKKQHPRNE